MLPPAIDLPSERSAIDATLVRLGNELTRGLPHDIAEAVRYSVRSPGKRLRGILVIFAYRAAGGTASPLDLAAAVEIVHAYSLVHDDLPCMDDDAMRRGRPTTHKMYGTHTATIAGVVMIPLAVRGILHAARSMGLPESGAVAIVQTLMHASGAQGMIGGQWRDLEAEGDSAKGPMSVERLAEVHRAKTGALMMASAKVGGIAAGAPPDQLAALERYGADIGLAFQIVDDILDVTATTAQLGKTAGRDADLRKSTYPALLGVEAAVDRAQQLVADGCSALTEAGLLTPELRYLADLVITRTH